MFHPIAPRLRLAGLLATATALFVSGLFAIAVSLTGQFLPHDERFLGMSSAELCELHECRIVHFMIHDRISFGGALIAIGILYLWLTLSPLKNGEEWAWWTLLGSGVIGFASFFAYLGYGYLDVWHGIATLLLLPAFALGLIGTYPMLSTRHGPRCLILPNRVATVRPLGRCLLLAAATGIFLGGLVIAAVGTTVVFVPQDTAFLGVDAAELNAINPRLVPLIAHDRAGFGGALACCGCTLFLCLRRGEWSVGLWCVLAVVGAIGFGTAIGVHPAIGYNDAVHLAPAVFGAVLFVGGLMLTYPGPTRALQTEASSCTPM
jgi:hypothetical protein